jgi:hypothetical protein
MSNMLPEIFEREKLYEKLATFQVGIAVAEIVGPALAGALLRYATAVTACSRTLRPISSPRS